MIALLLGACDSDPTEPSVPVATRQLTATARDNAGGAEVSVDLVRGVVNAPLARLVARSFRSMNRRSAVVNSAANAAAAPVRVTVLPMTVTVRAP